MTDPTVPNVIVAIASFLGCCLGILVTLMWTWNKDHAALDHLAAENCQLRKRLAATSGACQPSAKRIRELEASLAESDRIIEYYLGSKVDVIAGMHLYAAGADVDGQAIMDEYLTRQSGATQ